MVSPPTRQLGVTFPAAIFSNRAPHVASGLPEHFHAALVAGTAENREAKIKNCHVKSMRENQRTSKIKE